MASLDTMVEEYKAAAASAIHLLIIAPSKHGKSDYVAQAAIDGYDVIYIDADNGLPTLLDALKDHPEALKRVHYFKPASIRDFMLTFFKAPKIVYNERLKEVYAVHKAKPDDQVTILYPPRLRRYPNVIVAPDSWTSWALDALESAASSRKVELTDIDKYSRELYAPAGFFMTQMATAIQLAPFNIIVQAHPSVYEIKEKPPGRVAADVLEKDMIIKETWQIPMSTSNPHGYSIGKFFNQIGWLDINRLGQFELDFTPTRSKIIGGTVNPKKGDPRTTMRFKKLFGKGLSLPAPEPESFKWIETMTSEEYQESQKTTTKPATPAAPAKPATAAVPAAAPQLATKPAVKLGGALKLG